jgi:para-aminobenzoate synthetase/4-amino-4-deoxychorismate lyase
MRPPFVLIDDARARGAAPARLYRSPVGTIVAHAPGEVAPALAALRAALAAGRHAAGYVGYEAGLAIEPRLAARARPGDAPLLWFGLFDDVELIAPEAVPGLLPDPAGGFVGAPVPRIAQAAHAEAAARALALIAAGDIYQVNLTFAAEVALAGDPGAVYARLRATQEAAWGGIVATGAHWLLSASPELFFTIAGGAVTARPMKGTAARGAEPAADAAAAAALGADAKQRAENLMIVDLIRNDLARVAEPGSVVVPALFEIETYRTIHHMTSTVTARLARGRDAIDALAALFPCGSVTGAPKIRAMEVIDTLEPEPRGPYTGAIGWLDPAGDAGFNVAIRTLVLGQGEERARLGLGSAIVADSNARAEWRECLAKGAFVSAATPAFDLIETMRFEADEGLVEIERHLARMKASAQTFGFAFDRHEARNELQAATFRLRRAARVRLRLSRTGRIAIEVRALPAPPRAPVPVDIASRTVARSDYRLAHKTSDRAFHDEARAASGAFELLFEDEEGFLTEGSFTSLFVERGGRLVTPPLARGLLPGVLRARLIEEGRAIEGELRRADLAGGFLIGNALRGLLPARLK